MAAGEGHWLGVEELLQAPQPAARGKRARGAAATRTGAAPTAPTASLAPPPQPGPAAAAAPAGAAPAAEPPRSRIAGRAQVRKAFVSPSLPFSPPSAVPPSQQPAQPPQPAEQLVIRRPPRPKISPASAAAELPGEPQGPRDPRNGPGPRIDVGPFWSMLPIPDKHLQLLRDLQAQFRDEATLRALAEMLSEAEIPIKYYEWFVSHYARDHRTTQEIDVGDGSTAMLDVHDSYRSSRWAVRKRHWDFFGKRVKVAFDVDGATHLVSVSQLNAFLFARRFGLRELILDVHDDLERHYEQGKVESEAAAIRAAREAAREAGLPEDAPLKRKRGRRRKPKDAPPPVEPVMLSEGTVTTRLSLQD
jgi:hypothetical protein